MYKLLIVTDHPYRGITSVIAEYPTQDAAESALLGLKKDSFYGISRPMNITVFRMYKK
jgi:hypothetical protein